MVALKRKKPKEDGRQKIESKPIVESKNEAEPEAKSRKPWILIIGAIVLVAIVGGLAIWAYPYFMGNQDSDPSAEEEKAPESKHEKVKATLALEPFLVNLADTEDVRFVKATFKLGLEEKPGEHGDSDVAVAAMRDSIISLLSTKTAEQIMTPQGKDKLREEIRTQIGAVTSGVKILEVYIVDFVVQL